MPCKIKISKELLERKYIDLGLSHKKIAEEYNVTASAIKYWLDKYGIISRHRKNVLKIECNMKFGRLLTLKPTKDYYEKNPDREVWLCRCDCGKETMVDHSSLRSGRTASCGCLRREKVYRGYMDLGGQQWSRIKHQARMRNLEVKITIEEVWEIFEKQDRKCALSGVPIELKSNYIGKESNNTASLDRIDNSKGYLLDNVQWVHKTVNIMRNILPIDEFLEFCRKVTEYNVNKRTI